MAGGALPAFGGAGMSAGSLGTGLMGGGQMAAGPVAGAQPSGGLMSRMSSNFQGNGGMEEYMKMAQQMQGQGGGRQNQGPPPMQPPSGPIGNPAATQAAIQAMQANLGRNRRFGG
jgi:hypothetical protein